MPPFSVKFSSSMVFSATAANPGKPVTAQCCYVANKQTAEQDCAGRHVRLVMNCRQATSGQDELKIGWPASDGKTINKL
jgi:hypothetical protein